MLPASFCPTGRNIIFMAGGMSYGEMQFINDVAEQHHKEIIVGATAILTPDNYLDELRGML